MAQSLAEERIERLFELAEKRFREGEYELSDRYINLAQKIGMKTNTSLPSEFRRRVCQECGAFLVPGENCEVRLDSKSRTVNYHCKDCGHVNRYGY
ncbi:MAG: ribonuclease P protein component 4 [Candidatus Aenigmatarchaeota archaeon]